MKTNVFFAALAALAPVLSVQAATMVEVKDKNGLSHIYSQGSQGRMEMAGGGEYMLVDTAKGTAYVVMPERKAALDLSESLKKADRPDSDRSVVTQFKQRGSGPTIAGYKTIKFDYSAAGKYCGSLFVSKAALKESGMGHIFGAMQKMGAQAQSYAEAFNTNTEPCEAADQQITGKIQEIGMPLRALDKNGVLESEVTRIEKNAKLPPGAFSFPNNYEVQNVAQMQRGMQQQMQQQMPQMEQMLKQMQESGNLPPEAMEELERVRKMMQQQQPK